MKKLLVLAPVFVLFAAFTSQVSTPEIPADIKPLLEKNSCNACHALDKKVVGPSWLEIAAKKYPKKRIVDLVKKPEPGNWPGYAPMAAQPTVAKAELDKIATWLSKLK